MSTNYTILEDDISEFYTNTCTCINTRKNVCINFLYKHIDCVRRCMK